MAAQSPRIAQFARRWWQSDPPALILSFGPLWTFFGALAVSDARSAAASIVALGGMTMRRRAPWVALVLVVAAAAAAPGAIGLATGVCLVLWTLAGRCSWPQAVVICVATATTQVLVGVLTGIFEKLPGPGSNYPIFVTCTAAAATAAGLYFAERNRAMSARIERAERLEREQELLAEREISRERIRIAQEIHDIVAHTVSLMVVQAQATGAASDNPEVKAATRQLADLGRQAMREMHATVGLLRGSEASAPLSPRPGLRELDELITRARDAGMNVGLVRRGTQRELAPTVDLCAYRIIQEALTNVRIHQPAGWTQLQVSYEPDGLLLEIVDRLPAAVAAVSTAGNDVKSGHGLVGMRERAELFGGTLTATELDDGFQVRAFLPYEAPPQ